MRALRGGKEDRGAVSQAERERLFWTATVQQLLHWRARCVPGLGLFGWLACEKVEIPPALAGKERKVEIPPET